MKIVEIMMHLDRIKKRLFKKTKKEKDNTNKTNLFKLHLKSIDTIDQQNEEIKENNQNSDDKLKNVPDYHILTNTMNFPKTDPNLRFEISDLKLNPFLKESENYNQEKIGNQNKIKSIDMDFEDKNISSQTKMTNNDQIEKPLLLDDVSDIKKNDYQKYSQELKLNDEEKWIFTGISGFDELLEKGIPSGSNIIIAGGPGCGKTIFCLQTIYNTATEGKDCVFLSMEERPEKLKEHMLEFGFKVKEISTSEEEIILKANGSGRIALKRLQPIKLARHIEALLEKASGTLPVDIDLVLDFIPKEFNATILVLDSISAIETAFSGTKRQYRIYIEQLFRYFEEMNLTTLMITESSDVPHKFSSTGVEEFLADGIIVFYNFQGVKKRTRGAEIYKLRGASHSQRIAPMTITNKGIKISIDEELD